MLDLNEERAILAQGYKFIAGIDEAGRGPLAGPVIAACVIFPVDFKIDRRGMELVNDSKKISAKKRAELFPLIKSAAGEIGIGICDHATIDKINIMQAAFLAMKKAIGALKQKPDYILLDGKFPIPNFSLPQKAISRGDSIIFSIAAASIIAKVTRDRIMEKFDGRYPDYGFKMHKGYGTKFHLEQLARLGPSPIHRLSFSPIKDMID